MHEGLLRLVESSGGGPQAASPPTAPNTADVEHAVEALKKSVFRALFLVANPPASAGNTWIIERAVIFLQVKPHSSCLYCEIPRVVLVSCSCCLFRSATPTRSRGAPRC